MSRKKMSLDEFELLMRGLHREWLRDPSQVDTVSNESIFFGVKVHVFFAHDEVWPTLDGKEFKVSTPSWFAFRDSARYAALMLLVEEMRGKTIKSSEVEKHICLCVPAAGDIIAERALVEDEH